MGQRLPGLPMDWADRVVAGNDKRYGAEVAKNNRIRENLSEGFATIATGVLRGKAQKREDKLRSEAQARDDAIRAQMYARQDARHAVEDQRWEATEQDKRDAVVLKVLSNRKESLMERAAAGDTSAAAELAGLDEQEKFIMDRVTRSASKGLPANQPAAETMHAGSAPVGAAPAQATPLHDKWQALVSRGKGPGNPEFDAVLKEITAAQAGAARAHPGTPWDSVSNDYRGPNRPGAATTPVTPTTATAPSAPPVLSAPATYQPPKEVVEAVTAQKQAEFRQKKLEEDAKEFMRKSREAKDPSAARLWEAKARAATSDAERANADVSLKAVAANDVVERHKADIAAKAKAQADTEKAQQQRISHVNEFRTKLGAYGIKPTSADMKRMEPILGNPNNEINDVDALIENLFPGAKQAHDTQSKIASAKEMEVAGMRLNPVTGHAEKIARDDAKIEESNRRYAKAEADRDLARAEAAATKEESAFWKQKVELRKSIDDAKDAIDNLGEEDKSAAWQKGGAKWSVYWKNVDAIKALTKQLGDMGNDPPSKGAKPAAPPAPVAPVVAPSAPPAPTKASAALAALPPEQKKIRVLSAAPSSYDSDDSAKADLSKYLSDYAIDPASDEALYIAKALRARVKR